MSAAKLFLVGSVAIFTVVGLIGYMKRSGSKDTGIDSELSVAPVVQEVPISVHASVSKKTESVKIESGTTTIPLPVPEVSVATAVGLPDADRIRQLFATDSSKLPIVETVSYTSRAPWIQGRPAWIADYASHYHTSRHFIARSLNKKLDYATQKISPGDRFNVFKKDKNIQFYLLADLSRCRLWFYYIDLDQNERVLLKTYPIGVGRVDSKRKSGYLTPIGKYSCGDKIAIYKPGTMGFFHNEQVEMVRVFGTRWIPFDQEVENCTEAAKGLGLHGSPWVEDREKGLWSEDRSKIGKYDSDGCIRLYSEDIEEIFAIVITKPAVIEIVKDFHDAKLPGIEKNL